MVNYTNENFGSLNAVFRRISKDLFSESVKLQRDLAISQLKEIAQSGNLFGMDKRTALAKLDILLKITDNGRLSWTSTLPQIVVDGKKVYNYKNVTIKISGVTYFCKYNDTSNLSEVFGAFCGANSMLDAVSAKKSSKEFDSFEKWHNTKETLLITAGVDEKTRKNLLITIASKANYECEKNSFEKERKESINSVNALIEMIQNGISQETL